MFVLVVTCLWSLISVGVRAQITVKYREWCIFGLGSAVCGGRLPVVANAPYAFATLALTNTEDWTDFQDSIPGMLDLNVGNGRVVSLACAEADSDTASFSIMPVGGT